MAVTVLCDGRDCLMCTYMDGRDCLRGLGHLQDRAADCREELCPRILLGLVKYCLKLFHSLDESLFHSLTL